MSDPREMSIEESVQKMYKELCEMLCRRQTDLPDIAYKIPPHALHSLLSYVLHGNFPGSAMHGFLTNDLKEAIQKSDTQTWDASREIFQFIFNYIPAGCWGSEKRLNEWIRQRIEMRVKEHSTVGSSKQ